MRDSYVALKYLYNPFAKRHNNAINSIMNADPVNISKHRSQTVPFSFDNFGMFAFFVRHFLQKAKPQFLHPN